jgi:hypothetical protein
MLCANFTKPIWVSRFSRAFFSLSFGSTKVASFKWWVNRIYFNPSPSFHTSHRINYGLIGLLILLNGITTIHIIFNFTTIMENGRDGMVTWNASNVPLFTSTCLISQVYFKLLLSIFNLKLSFSNIQNQIFTCFNPCLFHVDLNFRKKISSHLCNAYPCLLVNFHLIVSIMVTMGLSLASMI